MRASKAIENYMIQQGENINVEIVDSLLYISPILNKTITSGYLYLATKTPKLYGKLYDLTNKEHKSRLQKWQSQTRIEYTSQNDIV